MRVVTLHDSQGAWERAAELLGGARCACALTGAGISVASGIPDFRSPGGLWSVFRPEEYATIEVFYRDPAKAWRLYRALGEVLAGKTANAAHEALAQLERYGVLEAVVTQNVDGLHQQAGSTKVFEIHGDHQQLHCLQCDRREPVQEKHLSEQTLPRCRACSFPLKPDVVLFGEPVRMLEEIEGVLSGCDMLLVAGTSAQVYPAAAIPSGVKQNGGLIFEFNREQTLGPTLFSGGQAITDMFFQGEVEHTLPRLVKHVAGRQ